MWFPLGVRAQTPSPTVTGLTQPVIFGNGLQTPLRFAGESVPTNQISLSFGASTFYDDNVLQQNRDRINDEALSFNSNLSLLRRTENLSFDLSYQPTFLLYKNTHQLDRLNDLGTLNLNYLLSPHFMIGLFDTITYQNGAFQSSGGQPILSGLGNSLARPCRRISNRRWSAARECRSLLRVAQLTRYPRPQCEDVPSFNRKSHLASVRCRFDHLRPDSRSRKFCIRRRNRSRA